MLTKFNLNDLIAIGKKSQYAILDQGLYSLTNFVLNIYLARTLSAFEYGAFGITFSIYLILFRPYSAIILEPLSVMLPGGSEENIIGHINKNLILQFGLTIPAGLLVIMIARILDRLMNSSLIFNETMLALGLFLPIIFLFWFFRQVFYILGKPVVSFVSSIVYTLVIFISLYIISNHHFSSVKAMMSIGIASTASCIFYYCFFWKRVKLNRLNTYIGQLFENWGYGKWMVLSSIFISIATELPLLMVSGFWDTSAAGIIKAAQNLIRPIQIFMVSVISISLPLLSKEFVQNRHNDLIRKLANVNRLLIGTALINGALLFILRRYLEKLLYGNAYIDYVDLFSMWGVVALFLSIFNGYSILIKVRQVPKKYVTATLAWALVSVFFGILLIPSFSVWGVTVTNLIGYLIAAIVVFILSEKEKKKLYENFDGA